MRLKPYQEKGSEFLRSRNRAALLDRPGLGKTAQAIDAWNRALVSRLLVIVPPVAAVTWEREIASWSPWSEVHRVSSGKDRLPKSGVTILPMSYLSRQCPIRAEVMNAEWPLVIVDEAHYFKNPKGRRTQALYGKNAIAARADRLWLLTGTLAPSQPPDLWLPLRALVPERMRNERGRLYSLAQFIDRYCDYHETRFGIRVTSLRNTEELKETLRMCCLRRTEAEVLPELPRLRRRIVDITATRPGREALREELRRLIDVDPDSLSSDELLARLRGTEFSTYRRLCGEIKGPPAADWIANELESGVEKLIVFAVHRAVMNELSGRLQKFGVVELRGGLTPVSRQAAIDAFQKSPSVRVIVCQLAAASTALTLTAANNVVFAESDWVPGTNEQAEKRAHRIGQDRPVLVTYLAVHDSVDHLITEAVTRKQRLIGELFGNVS